ncbi:MAG: hypothetical protein JSV44_03620 [Candidatus Zixiibacteriota bacterium]|nr:MAG: hypothetical protein JSV44_03620 [candidate division Zixibacteria bacterium]
MNRIILTVLLGGIIIAGFGCQDEHEIFNPTYRDQLLRLIVDTDDGREIYSANLFPDESFARDDSDDRYFYLIESRDRSISIVIANEPKKIDPYESIYDALATIIDVYIGSIQRINPGGDTTLAYPFRSTIVRYAYFLKLFNDSYPYLGWRLWGYYSPGNNPTADRRMVSSSGHVQMSLNGQFNNPPNPLGYYNTNYLLYDDAPIFPLGDTITYTSDVDDLCQAQTGAASFKMVNTEADASSYKGGWRIINSKDPFHRLILIESAGVFHVDILDPGIPVVESSLVRTEDYVVFYKTQ